MIRFNTLFSDSFCSLAFFSINFIAAKGGFEIIVGMGFLMLDGLLHYCGFDKRTFAFTVVVADKGPDLIS